MVLPTSRWNNNKNEMCQSHVDIQPLAKTRVIASRGSQTIAILMNLYLIEKANKQRL